MPQPQPALPGYRSARAALIRLFEGARRFLRLTLLALWAKIIRHGDDRGVERLERVRTPGKRPYMAGPKEDFILMMVGGLTLDPTTKITLDPTTKMPIVVLKDPDNKLNLPIWIGPLEAASMATELEGIKPQRPMTHDLIRNLIGELGATVEGVEITELRENTYLSRCVRSRRSMSPRQCSRRRANCMSRPRTPAPASTIRISPASRATNGPRSSRRCRPTISSTRCEHGMRLRQAVERPLQRPAPSTFCQDAFQLPASGMTRLDPCR